MLLCDQAQGVNVDSLGRVDASLVQWQKDMTVLYKCAVRSIVVLEKQAKLLDQAMPLHSASYLVSC